MPERPGLVTGATPPTPGMAWVASIGGIGGTAGGTVPMTRVLALVKSDAPPRLTGRPAR